VTLQELAAFSDEELLERLRPRSPQMRPSDLAWYRFNPGEARPLAARAPRKTAPTVPSAPPPAAEADAGLAVALELEQTFGRVAQRVFPSVIGITSWRRTDGAPAQPSGWSTAGSEAERYPGFEMARAGSGFFVTADGYLLTCHHLLIDPRTQELAELFEVEFEGNLRYRARIIGLEPTVDLAVLKVDVPFATRPAAVGDPETVRVGRWAIAVGDPPGVERTFAPGTISARPERDCYQENRTATLLQTSIRAGNGVYGGPLVDIHGEVIGLSVPPSWIAASIDGAPVFGLPIELATTLFEALKIKESQRSPWLGFSVLELGWQLRRQLPWAPMTGIYIDDVFTPSPASRAGVRVGDVLHAMDGQRMLSVADLQRWLYLFGIGHTVRLEIYREGGRVEIETPIDLRPQAATPR
jgi:S1-C subfamily serine protease